LVDVLVGSVSVDVAVGVHFDLALDLNLVATFDGQSILVGMATRPASSSTPWPWHSDESPVLD
jgi:hypothetical protein